MSKNIINNKKNKTMNNNELIIQETIKSLESTFNREPSSARTGSISDFEQTQDNIYNIMTAGSRLAEKLIYSVDTDTLNVSNWFKVLNNSLSCNSYKVYHYVLDKFNLEDNELHSEVFDKGFNSIYESLVSILESSQLYFWTTKVNNELDFLENFIDIDDIYEEIEGPWDRFISYVFSKAEFMLEGTIENYSDEEYLSQFDEEDDEREVEEVE
jgi:hypothetical protein